jgi:hypothetical protein
MWFEYTIEGDEFDLLICGELKNVVTEWRLDPEVGRVPEKVEVVFVDLEATHVFNDHWEDLPAEEAKRLARQHEPEIVESCFDACTPGD